MDFSGVRTWEGAGSPGRVIQMDLVKFEVFETRCLSTNTIKNLLLRTSQGPFGLFFLWSRRLPRSVFHWSLSPTLFHRSAAATLGHIMKRCWWATEYDVNLPFLAVHLKYYLMYFFDNLYFFCFLPRNDKIFTLKASGYSTFEENSFMVLKITFCQ